MAVSSAYRDLLIRGKWLGGIVRLALARFKLVSHPGDSYEDALMHERRRT